MQSETLIKQEATDEQKRATMLNVAWRFRDDPRKAKELMQALGLVEYDHEHAWTALRSQPPSWLCRECGVTTHARPA